MSMALIDWVSTKMGLAVTVMTQKAKMQRVIIDLGLTLTAIMSRVLINAAMIKGDITQKVTM